MLFFIYISLLLLQILPNIQSGSIHYLNQVVFHNSVQKQPHFVLFYAPWCSHCKGVLLTWKELSESAEDKTGVKIGKVNCAEETKLCSELNILSYPTMKIFNHELVSRFEGKRTIEELSLFIQYTLKKQARILSPEVKEGLVTLTTDSFDRQIANGLNFVEFYAPWCVHCQRFAPTWRALAKAMENDHYINICKIDCSVENAKCKEHHVTGLPTLKLYKNGMEFAKYNLDRDINTLLKYVQAHVDLYSKQQNSVNIDETRNTESLVNDQKNNKVLEEKSPEQKLKEFTAFVELDDKTIDIVVVEPTFVMFYLKDDQLSMKLYPYWVLLGKIFQEEDGPVIARLNCSRYPTTCNKYKVNTFPKLVLFKYDEIIVYDGEFDVESLKQFALNNHDEL